MGESSEVSAAESGHHDSKPASKKQKFERGIKTKSCFCCLKPTTVAFRVQHDSRKAWQFVCPDCLSAVKTNNPHYVYGGTWKGSRH
ncbi:MAG: hypothetical protein ACRCZF_14060 [Gemmataceae bacterium]